MKKDPRRTIIETGSILGNVLQRDRENSGREAPPSELAQGAFPASQEDDLQDNLPADKPVSESDSQQVSQLTSKLSDEGLAGESRALVQPASLPASQQASKPVSLSKRELSAAARELADSRLVTVSLKLPEAINDWLDQYAFAHRKDKVLKQDLVAKAVQLLYVELEGEG